MTTIEWTDSMAVGIYEIDNQHRKLFESLNSLLDAMSQGQGNQQIMEILKFLEEYVVIHFGTEERYMEQTGYPGYPAHKAQHDAFAKDFAALKQEFLNHDRPTYLRLQVEVGHRLIKWLISHIGEVDTKLGKYLQEKGIE